jgi:predicted N-acetyltransferase YhbS
MSPKIVPMRMEHAKAVSLLRCAAFFEGSSRTPDQDAGELCALVENDDFETALVAIVEGQPVGAVLLVRHELDAAHDLTPWLAGLVVAEDHRHLGIGSALVRALEERAVSLGVETLHLYTWEARDFYVRLGWTEVESFVQDGEAAVLMSRKLRS